MGQITVSSLRDISSGFISGFHFRGVSPKYLGRGGADYGFLTGKRSTTSTDLMTMTRHRTISGQVNVNYMSGQDHTCSDNMAGRKYSDNVDGATLALDAKRWTASVNRVEKWIAENERHSLQQRGSCLSVLMAIDTT